MKFDSSSQQLSLADIDAKEWRRPAFITPLLEAGYLLVTLFAVVVYNFRDYEEIFTGLTGLLKLNDLKGKILLVLVALLFLGGLILVWSFIALRFKRYAVTEKVVAFQTGVFFRKTQLTPLNRVLSVDLVRPFLASLLGYATVHVICAGAADSKVVIQYLALKQAKQLRVEVLQLVKRAKNAENPQVILDKSSNISDPCIQTQNLAGLEQENDYDFLGDIEIIRVANWQVVAEEITRHIFANLMAIAATVAFYFTNGFWAIILVVFGWGWALLKRVQSRCNFRLGVSATGFHINRGLFTRFQQTIAPNRVVAVKLEQSLIGRLFGWWLVRADVPVTNLLEDENSEDRNFLGSALTQQQALTTLWMLIPDLGTNNPQILLNLAIYGDRNQGGFVGSPARARWLDWFGAHKNGMAITNTVTVIRSGWLRREITFIPHGRTQEISYQRGPLQQLCQCASIKFGSVSQHFKAIAHHIEADAAYNLFIRQTQIAADIRRGEDSSEWYRRISAQIPQLEDYSIVNKSGWLA